MRVHSICTERVLSFTKGPTVRMRILTKKRVVKGTSITKGGCGGGRRARGRRVSVGKGVRLLGDRVTPRVVNRGMFRREGVSAVLGRGKGRRASFTVSLTITQTTTTTRGVPLCECLKNMHTMRPDVPRLIEGRRVRVRGVGRVGMSRDAVLAGLFREVLRRRGRKGGLVLDRRATKARSGFLMSLTITTGVALVLIRGERDTCCAMLGGQLLRLRRGVNK